MTDAHADTEAATDLDEEDRNAALVDAETKALLLFDEVVARGLIRPGVAERQLSDEIRVLANEMFDIRRFWHKRIVRTGVNTLEPYRANPADLVVAEDDIVFLDFGPLFEQWEADVGRTYVIGDDPAKHRLAADLPRIWDAGERFFAASPDITGAELFDHVLGLIAEAGWGHGASHAGHQVGEFPHEKINGDDVNCYITHGSDAPMRRLAGCGHPCHWILEVHLVDTERGFGGFYEQLLDLHPKR